MYAGGHAGRHGTCSFELYHQASLHHLGIKTGELFKTLLKKSLGLWTPTLLWQSLEATLGKDTQAWGQGTQAQLRSGTLQGTRGIKGLSCSEC